MDANKARLSKISSNLAEPDRVAMLASSTKSRDDIREILGYDVVNHEALVKIAAQVWNAVPIANRPKFTAEDWREAIHGRCAKGIEKAERVLAENNPEPKLLAAKVRTLRTTFSRQVIRAMQDVHDEAAAKRH